MGQAQGHAATQYRMKQLLIHADPGARAHFVANWLYDQLDGAGFDVGATVYMPFVKIHDLKSVDQLTSFSGPRIRIRPTFDKLGLHLLLFLRKNVHIQLLDFTRNEFSIDTFSKVYIFAKERFDMDCNLNYLLYDHVINFEDTFDLEKLIELYQKINRTAPSQTNISNAVHNNTLNQIELDRNHACSIAAMVLEAESKLNLLEKNRHWSIPVLYETTPLEELYQTIKSKITLENYQTN
jgi:hypothetical protein